MTFRTYDVSVVICTYNRCDQLGKALTAVLSQAPGVAYEVIVVDNNSSDATREVVAAKLDNSSNHRYLFEARQGLQFARNTGLMAASAPIVAFTDDDVYVGPEWVATLKRVFDEHPDVDMIGGRVRPIWPRDVPSWITPRQLGPFALGERGDVPIRVSAANAAPCLVGANFAFRRTVFDRIGPFDPDYPRSEDREIQLRLWRAGGVGLYVPTLQISVDIPADRLTKAYFRHWYTTYGIYHSRMGLLDSIDRDGRLMEPPARRLFGTPPFIWRQLAAAGLQWAGAMLRFETSMAFYWENQFRYLLSYTRERHRSHAATRRHSALSEVARFLMTPRGGRPEAAA
jgi:glycosyltransferase involved in cell wall biosynthesis